MNLDSHKKLTMAMINTWSTLKRCQEKIPTEKSPPWGVMGRVSVRLGIGLGSGFGGLFSGGDFFLEPFKKIRLNRFQEPYDEKSLKNVWRVFKKQSCI